MIDITTNDEVLEKDENATVLLPRFSCHTLRHTFTTRLIEAGVNPKVVQDTLGHKDISTTLGIYASVTNEFKEENPDTPVITMSMGKMGMISRLCGESFGAAVTFAAHKKASAPGQMEMHEVADILEKMHKIIK